MAAAAAAAAAAGGGEDDGYAMVWPLELPTDARLAKCNDSNSLISLIYLLDSIFLFLLVEI